MVHPQVTVTLMPVATPAAQLVTNWRVGGQSGEERTKLTLLCPACLSRSLSACLSFPGFSFAGETLAALQPGAVRGLRLGLT